MKKELLKPGDIILIPAGNNRYGVAKVLYTSKVFKNLMLIGVYNIGTQAKQMPEQLPEVFHLPPIYTSIAGVKKGSWIKVGTQPLTETEKGLSKRVVAGAVWIEDQFIGPATEAELNQLPQMEAWGLGLVEEEIQDMLDKQK